MKKLVVVARIAIQLAFPVCTVERAFMQVKVSEVEVVMHEVKHA